MSGKSCGKRKRRLGKRGSCGGKRKVRRLVLVPLVTAVVLFSAIFVYLQAVIDPNLEDISRMRAEVLVTRTINRALSELFQEQTVEEDLFLLKKDENGNKEYQGILKSFDDEKITMEKDECNEEVIELERKNIAQIKTIYNW